VSSKYVATNGLILPSQPADPLRRSTFQLGMVLDTPGTRGALEGFERAQALQLMQGGLGEEPAPSSPAHQPVDFRRELLRITMWVRLMSHLQLNNMWA